MKKADDSALVPKAAAVRLSRTKPSTRDIIVNEATTLMFFKFFDTRAVLGAPLFLSKCVTPTSQSFSFSYSYSFSLLEKTHRSPPARIPNRRTSRSKRTRTITETIRPSHLSPFHPTFPPALPTPSVPSEKN